MKKILLFGKCGKNKKILVDDNDYLLISKYKWYVDSKGYAYREKSNPKRIFIHQFIMGQYPQGKTEIDHINNNKLDNQRHNLRFCTSNENRLNRKKYNSNKSGYKGVHWHKQGKKWLARIYVNKVGYYLGLYDTAKKAGKACKIKETELKAKR